MVHSVKGDGTIGELFLLQDQVVDALGNQLGAAPDLSRRAARDSADRIDRPASPVTPAAAPSARRPAEPETRSSPAEVATATAMPAAGFTAPTMAIDGPPPPRPPDTIRRDADGRGRGLPREEVREVAGFVNSHLSSIQARLTGGGAVVVISERPRVETQERVEAMRDRTERRSRAQVPFPSQGRGVASRLELAHQRGVPGGQARRLVAESSNLARNRQKYFTWFVCDRQPSNGEQKGLATR